MKIFLLVLKVFFRFLLCILSILVQILVEGKKMTLTIKLKDTLNVSFNIKHI